MLGLSSPGRRFRVLTSFISRSVDKALGDLPQTCRCSQQSNSSDSLVPRAPDVRLAVRKEKVDDDADDGEEEDDEAPEELVRRRAARLQDLNYRRGNNRCQHDLMSPG